MREKIWPALRLRRKIRPARDCLTAQKVVELHRRAVLDRRFRRSGAASNFGPYAGVPTIPLNVVIATSVGVSCGHLHNFEMKIFLCDRRVERITSTGIIGGPVAELAHDRRQSVLRERADGVAGGHDFRGRHRRGQRGDHVTASHRHVRLAKRKYRMAAGIHRAVDLLA